MTDTSKFAEGRVLMRRIRIGVFYLILFLYAAYNCFWFIGTMFSFGKNDTKEEALYFLFTFIIDIPVVWCIYKNVRIGLTLFTAILITSIVLGYPSGGLNSFLVPVIFYGPKLLVVALAVWTNRSVQTKKSKSVSSPIAP